MQPRGRGPAYKVRSAASRIEASRSSTLSGESMRSSSRDLDFVTGRASRRARCRVQVGWAADAGVREPYHAATLLAGSVCASRDATGYSASVPCFPLHHTRPAPCSVLLTGARLVGICGTARLLASHWRRAVSAEVPFDWVDPR